MARASTLYISGYPLVVYMLICSYNLQAKLKSIESQLNEALNSSDARSTVGSESASVISTPKMMESTADSSSVTKRLEEELAKRDALIEVPDTLCDYLSSLCIIFSPKCMQMCGFVLM
jgi:hypothetical protein